MSLEAKPQVHNEVARLEEDEHVKGESLWMDAWRRLRRNRAATMGVVIILLNLLLAVFAPFVTPSANIPDDYTQPKFAYQTLDEKNVAPEWIINLFPTMIASDQIVGLDNPTNWEIAVDNGDQVSRGDLLATNTENGQTRNAVMDGIAFLDGNNVGVTKANVRFHEVPPDEGWEVLLTNIDMMRPVDANTVIARTADNEQVVETEFRAQVSLSNDVLRVKEQNGGYVEVSDRYPIGADFLGRDLLTRIIYGARVSLSVAFIGPAVALLIGLSVGLTSGYAGGWVDNLIMRFVDIMYAFPTILLIILLMAFFRSSFTQAEAGTFTYYISEADRALGGMLFIFIGIGATAWMSLSRLTRGQVLSVREMEYVEAARSIGTPRLIIIRQHILPNILGPIIVAETLTIPTYISYEAFLSFIGLGVNPPTPSWGAMIADGAEAIATYPSQALFPAMALFFIMFAFNFLGDGLRDALDPRMRGVD
jgi:oligopeptide transport system permease protein